MIVAGIGCRREATTDAILALLRDAIARAGCTAVDVLAVPDFLATRTAVRLVAERMAIPRRNVSGEAMAQVLERCVTRSETVARHVGLDSVAEAAALALAGPDGKLILPRITGDGVTCALAQAP